MIRFSKNLTLVIALVVSFSGGAGIVAGPAAASGSFDFFGGGFGHGVGMSQYGALGMAKQGMNYKDILTTFYTGTAVQTQSLPPNIRVGIAWQVSDFHVQARSGPVELHIGSPGGTLVGKIPSGDNWQIKSGSGQYRVLDQQGHVVGGHEWGGPNTDLFATYESNNSMLFVKEGGDTGGRSYMRGHLEFNIYNGGRERLIAVVSPQEYDYGIGEVPSEWPADALKAQAVASRTYAFYHKQHDGTLSWCNCDVTDTTQYQVYLGAGKELGPGGDKWVSAVNATQDEVVTYNGNLIDAQFASSDGGATEDVENVWGGPALPYLRGVCDPGDYTSSNSLRTWKRSFTAANVTSRLAGATGNIGTVKSFTNEKRGVSGRIIAVQVNGSSGHRTISGSALQFGLGLASDLVWINQNRLIVGPIRSKYDGVNCRPKLPTSGEVALAGGTKQSFQDGAIFYRKVSGPHWLHDPVLAFYSGRGGPGGTLGFPTSDVKDTSGGGTEATFQRGKISCDSGGSCSIS